MTLGRSAKLSHPGRRRRRNEDEYVHEPPLFAVADGMGGAQAGEVAAQLAAGALREGGGVGGGEERVVALIKEANRRVFQRSSEDAAASGMGTTMTAALVEDGAVWIGHVGDSRAYLVRDGKLEQLTEDHSLVAELQRSGKLSAEEAGAHPQRSVITRVLGTDPDVDVDTFRIEPRTGDVFLICSDGLTTMVDDSTILGIVEENRTDLDAVAQALVNAANRAGGEDNITVVAFEISDEAAEEELEQTAQYPAPGTAAKDPDEEDTLSGLDAVPALEGDTMVVPPAPREPAGEEVAVEPHRFEHADDLEPEPPSRLRRFLGWLVIFACALGAAYLVWRLVR